MDTETTPLINKPGASASTSEVVRCGSSKLLPVPFLAALAVASTAATEIYAYAALLCKDPKHCQDGERRQYTSTVSVGVAVANICALLALGPFAKLCRRRPLAGLSSWFVFRSMSALALVLGVSFDSLLVTMSGRLFEGFASDNLLHFMLNAIYVQEPKYSLLPLLIGSSQAGSMAGICIGPTISSLLPNFRASFFMALTIFATGLVYLLILSRTVSVTPTTVQQTKRERSILVTIISPLKVLQRRPRILVPCLSLLLFNLVQSFIFVTVLTYTTVYWAFTSKQNGFLLSITHAIAAAYLLVNLFVLPRFVWLKAGRGHICENKFMYNMCERPVDESSAYKATISMLMEATALVFFLFIQESWQIYVIVAMMATGLAAPSFIRSYTASLVDVDDAADAITSLTLFETAGSLLAPFIIGTAMVVKQGSAGLILSASALSLSSLLLTGSLFLKGKRKAVAYET